MSEPSTAVDNGKPGDGRDGSGRFTRGNRHGKGNPHHSRVALLRSTLLESVSSQDVEDVIRMMVERAKEGDIPAAKEVLQRCLGPAQAMDVLERLAAIEERLEAVAAGRVR